MISRIDWLVKIFYLPQKILFRCQLHRMVVSLRVESNRNQKKQKRMARKKTRMKRKEVKER